MKKILLNCTPPYQTNMPFLAISVLKTFMEREGVKTDICYWNHKQERTLERFCGLGSLIYNGYFYRLLPFQAMYALERGDQEVLNRIAYFVLAAKPEYQAKGRGFVLRYIKASVDYLIREIDYYIDDLELDQYELVGFPCHFNQWIPASIIAGRIKKRFPHIPIVVGGMQNRSHGVSMMNSIGVFDYAIWGEGEHALLDLYRALEEKKTDMSSIAKLIYREGDEIKSTQRGSHYSEFTQQLFPDYTDFVNVIGTPHADHCLPLEGSRGCSWHRCHFCFLSTGYRPRAKKIECLLAELDHQIKTTGINSFQFADADLFGTLGNLLEEFLDKLIEYKNNVEPGLKLRDIEIITRDVTFDIIRKIGMIGVNMVHIGYESPSNELLKKIEKKNTFASNFFFNKWARHFGISSIPFQAIQSLLEETTDDICEAIDNLYCYRFMVDNQLWNHSYSTLVINSLSPYYKMIKEGKYRQKLKDDSFESLYLPKGVVKEEDQETLFSWTVDYINPMWEKFIKIENYYIANNFSYFVYNAPDHIVYTETANGNCIRTVEFQKSSNEYRILESADKRIVSIDDLIAILEYGEKPVDGLKNAINYLKDLGLVYVSYDYSEIVSVIALSN